MLHGAYNIQNWQKDGKLKELCRYLQELNKEDKIFKKLEDPIATRWWLVAVCA